MLKTRHTNEAVRAQLWERQQRLHTLLADNGKRRRVLLLLTLVNFLIVSGLALLVRSVAVLPIDLWATRELQEHPRAILFQTMYAISMFGYQPWAVITLLMGMLLVGVWLGWRSSGYIFALVVAQGLLNAAFKLIVGRPRPVSSLVDVLVPERGNSFPSGHVMFYTVFFGMLCFLVWAYVQRPWVRWSSAVIPTTLILLIGPSRMTLGSHWLSDVIAAYLLGLLCLAFGIEGYVTWVAPRLFAAQTSLNALGDEQQCVTTDPVPPGTH